MANENTSIGMEFEAIDGIPVPEIPEIPEETENDEEVKKVSVFRKVGHVISAPFRFVGRMIKKSPGSAVVGAAIGGAAGVGGKMLYDHFVKKAGGDAGYEPETDEYENDMSNVVEFTHPTDDVDEAM